MIQLHDKRLHIELEAALRENMSLERFRHSQRVAKTAWLYAAKFDINQDDAWVAGISHDFAREWSGSQLLQFVQSHDGFIDPVYKAKHLLLHGRAAALLVSKNFGVTKPDILEAMEHHTLGKPGMSPLAKLLFCADYLEPGRKFTTVSFRRLMRLYCLDCLVCRVIEHCEERFKSIHPWTQAMYEESGKLCTGTPCPGHQAVGLGPIPDRGDARTK